MGVNMNSNSNNKERSNNLNLAFGFVDDDYNDTLMMAVLFPNEYEERINNGLTSINKKVKSFKHDYTCSLEEFLEDSVCADDIESVPLAKSHSIAMFSCSSFNSCEEFGDLDMFKEAADAIGLLSDLKIIISTLCNYMGKDDASLFLKNSLYNREFIKECVGEEAGEWFDNIYDDFLKYLFDYLMVVIKEDELLTQEGLLLLESNRT